MNDGLEVKKHTRDSCNPIPDGPALTDPGALATAAHHVMSTRPTALAHHLIFLNTSHRRSNVTNVPSIVVNYGRIVWQSIIL